MVQQGRLHCANICTPPTPNSELANSLKVIAESEAEAGIRFRIVETGGRSVKSILQKSNPTANVGCEEEDCLPCRPGRGEGGDCRRCGINYSVECQLCPDGQKAIYHGETARNLYTRGMDHEENFRARREKSFMLKHQTKEHQGSPGSYTARMNASAKDCLNRQVGEAVHLRRSSAPTLNGKTEWHQPPLFRIQSEILRD